MLVAMMAGCRLILYWFYIVKWRVPFAVQGTINNLRNAASGVAGNARIVSLEVQDFGALFLARIKILQCTR